MAIVLPGDGVDPAALLPPSSSHPQKPLRLGPGLRLLYPSADLAPTVPGLLSALAAERRKNNLLWVEPGPGGRYFPATGDFVVGQVLHGGADQAVVALAPHDAPPLRALLPVLSFAGASRKNRPDLQPGTLVYARVAFAAPRGHMDTELECVDSVSGKSNGLGVLTGGTVFSVSLSMARRLLLSVSSSSSSSSSSSPESTAGLVVLEALAQEGLAFETAVGRNGRLWVRAATAADKDDKTSKPNKDKKEKADKDKDGERDREATRTVILVGRAVLATDAQNLDPAQQRALVRKLVRGGG